MGHGTGGHLKVKSGSIFRVREYVHAWMKKEVQSENHHVAEGMVKVHVLLACHHVGKL